MRTRRPLGHGPDDPDAADALQALRVGRPATVAELAAAAAEVVGHGHADPGAKLPAATPQAERRSLGDGPSS
ncbi:hypothetical protein [Streptantibioticus ferralitis]|uniref:Uncharacterized protein n=1 Tax=Streptantibioticus ferralitis TaxID=236510 RepID=A0ABT5ZC28_9ACTN|nr:hypothetical protein [Streptantibioticus ferralitis]MDF2261401.1 hypothetical protein [Streptantibioticus ferralitis]